MTNQELNDLRANHGFDLITMRCKFTGQKRMLDLLISDALDAIEIDCPEQPTLFIAIERLTQLRRELNTIKIKMIG